MRSDFITKIASALLTLIIGAVVIARSATYTTGTLGDMGPGYYPRLLGFGLIAITVLILTTSTRAHATPSKTTQLPGHARTWAAVICSLGAFILIGKYGGLVPATFAMIALAALGDRANRLRDIFWLALGTTLATVLTFHYGLALQFQLFNWG